VQHRELGKTGVRLPPIVFGTSCLGNLYRALSDDTKLAIMAEWFRWGPHPVAVDSAGKYGAGLALEVLGRGLRALQIRPDEVIISNKLAWVQTPLRTPEPTFEPGAWVGLQHDAQQRISYDGMMQCWEQGCALLGPGYSPQLISVHDPDEYLGAARSEAERRTRWEDVVGAYRALHEVKHRGEAAGVGVGAKDWRVIRELAERVELDWVMFACSLTVYRHPRELLAFMAELHSLGVGMINSAVFNAGFLTGGAYFDYRRLDPDRDGELFAWRERFHRVCAAHGVEPAAACVRFAMSPPGVISVALNTSSPERIRQNVAAVQASIPPAFWRALKDERLLDRDYPYVG
jgi:D-threo-aldose 1-dehydrogenase